LFGREHSEVKNKDNVQAGAPDGATVSFKRNVQRVFRPNRSTLLVVKSFIGILLLSAVSTVSSMAGEAAPLRKAPELAFTLPGEGEKLLSQYRGRVVALEFILTTCPHCQASSRDLTKYQQDMGKRGLQVIDLAINALDDMRKPSEAQQIVLDFIRTYQVGFPVGYIPRPQMLTFLGFSPTDRMVVPQLVLIDRKGFIHYQTSATSGPDWDNVAKEPALREHLEELLAMGSTTTAPRPKSKMVAISAKK
jgi:hypothetical protein